MNLLIMGLPGAGKGTQAAKIVDKYQLIHISTGDMFREAISNQTEMGVLAKSYIDKGELVPDEVTNGIVKERLGQSDVREKGFLLDGYPRTLDQAHALSTILSSLKLQLNGVIDIEVEPNLLVDRLSGRFICRNCGATYHKIFNPTKQEGKCDQCGENDFYQREDDKPETVKRRLDLNIEQSKPLLSYYDEENMVTRIDGAQDIDKVFADITKTLDKITK